MCYSSQTGNNSLDTSYFSKIRCRYYQYKIFEGGIISSMPFASLFRPISNILYHSICVNDCVWEVTSEVNKWHAIIHGKKYLIPISVRFFCPYHGFEQTSTCLSTEQSNVYTFFLIEAYKIKKSNHFFIARKNI